ncbi:hypothetical protein [Pseudomonas kribbensis]|uniref:Uncharacterized protein n=1 Tax=Pseudomonas kribbensis TaxID=1628086 RepID=A0A4Y8VHX0_9PSED|nr:hypothetical protein [Pseudomonas kribbensis]TFH79873.1 hypothetical protein E4J90_14450 [Pseudomonas kribbensis]
MTLKLTVIDQSPIHGDRSAGEAVGYFRYLLGEYHDSIHFAGTAPEILIVRITSATHARWQRRRDPTTARSK